MGNPIGTYLGNSVDDTSVVLSHGAVFNFNFPPIFGDDAAEAHLDALSLKTAQPADLGGGVGIQYITLSSSSGGAMFETDLGVPITYQVHKDSISGAVVASDSVTLVQGDDDFGTETDPSTNESWHVQSPTDDVPNLAFPPPDALVIPGLNVEEDGQFSEGRLWWPQTPLTLHGGKLTLVLSNARPAANAIPLPPGVAGGFFLLACGTTAMASRRLLRRLSSAV